MQERAFLPDIGVGSREFWKEVTAQAEELQADNILLYMQLMLKRAAEKNVPVRRTNIVQYGKSLPFFDGVLPYDDEAGRNVEGWFDRIDEYGRLSGIKVEHYIVSSGLEEMIRGTPIAKKIKRIYASKFLYDHNDAACWPGLAVNYTTKTQFLFRINKGKLDVHDEGVNEFVPKEERPIPFSRMIFLGDGDTDIPCFRTVKEQGGHSIAVFPPGSRKKKRLVEQYAADGRVNFVSQADYRERAQLDVIVKAIIDKIQLDNELTRLR